MKESMHEKHGAIEWQKTEGRRALSLARNICLGGNRRQTPTNRRQLVPDCERRVSSLLGAECLALLGLA